ncbi:MAG TPA: DUF1835 domain-containing protein [Gammaproteobacteria bacterium]|nr:DUF1835 domain-containing protein [Gammaproteobacteria bacterium]
MTASQQRLLHITNGDFSANLLKQLPSGGDVIAWQDILHEGPVPGHLSLEELNRVRAEYLSNAGYGDYQSILSNFLRRNSQLEKYNTYSEVILWFEHDLYDQLQLLQLLAWFSEHNLTQTQLTLVCIGEHPQITPFFGFGQLNVKQMAELFTKRQPIPEITLILGKTFWQAFRESNPANLFTLMGNDLSALPFLRNAMQRFLDEYPSLYNGLNWTEHYILQALDQGKSNLYEIFQQLPENEGQYFMGLSDSCFFNVVKRLSIITHPLLVVKESPAQPTKITAELTELGKQVLTGQADWVTINGINRWLGGVHLQADCYWRWDKPQKRLVMKSLKAPCLESE